MKRLYLITIDLTAFLLNKIFGVFFFIYPKLKYRYYTKAINFCVNRESILNYGLRVSYLKHELTDTSKIISLVKKLKPYFTDKELIRFGLDNDGGYLIPNDLGGIIACFSPGVESTAGFEEDCIKQNINCFLADGSVSEAPINNDSIHFLKKYLNAYNDNENITLDTWINQSVKNEGDMILQMDIEGAEIETLLATKQETINRFRIIVLEVHTLQSLVLRSYYQVFNAMMTKLLVNHTCVHIHPNNYSLCWKFNENLLIPETMEFTFLRNDRIKSKKPATTFPHPLDMVNNVNKPSLHLPKCWYE